MKHTVNFFIWLTVLGLLCIAWKPPLPRLFLIGDSISIQYTPYLESFLAGTAILTRKTDDGEAAVDLNFPKGANGGDSGMVLAYLRQKLQQQDFQPDLLILNCGLHDIKTPIGETQKQVGESAYRNNLREIQQLTQQAGIQLIWVRTTPVVDSIHNHPKNKWMHRFAMDVDRYNEIADSLFQAKDIPIIDLHRFTERLGTAHYVDHVHYDHEARRLQAAYMAGFLTDYLHHHP